MVVLLFVTTLLEVKAEEKGPFEFKDLKRSDSARVANTLSTNRYQGQNIIPSAEEIPTPTEQIVFALGVVVLLEGRPDDVCCLLA